MKGQLKEGREYNLDRTLVISISRVTRGKLTAKVARKSNPNDGWSAIDIYITRKEEVRPNAI